MSITSPILHHFAISPFSEKLRLAWRSVLIPIPLPKLDDEISSSQAVGVAATAAGHAPVAVQRGLGFDVGEPVTMAATDFGTDAVAGTLVGLAIDRVTLRREDERAGVVHVHFPRIGYRIKRASTP